MFCGIVGVLAAFAIGAVIWLMGGDENEPVGATREVVVNSNPSVASATNKEVKNPRVRRDRNQSGLHRDALSEKIKISLDDEEETELTFDQRKLLEDIRAAFDGDDRKRLIALVRKMQQSDEWPDGIPAPLKRVAIDAVRWFGGECLAEAVGFLADRDEEIRQDAAEVFNDAIFEANGDMEKSQLLIAAAKVVDDRDTMDSLMMTLNEMRNSRAVETIKEIWKSGSSAAKDALPEAIEFLTSEENITTPEQLDQWYNDPSGDNLDPEDAEEMYGPQKDM